MTRFSPNELSTTFIQNDEVIEVPVPNSEGVPSDSNTVNPEYCTAYNIAWDERDRQAEIGGFGALNSALALPMVVVLSIWADVSTPLGARQNGTKRKKKHVVSSTD